MSSYIGSGVARREVGPYSGVRPCIGAGRPEATSEACVFALQNAGGGLYSSRVTPRIYLTPPIRCEPLGEIVRRFGGTVDYRAAGPAPVYPLPGHAADDVRAFWGGLALPVGAETFVARLPGGRVFGSGAVLSPDGESIARDVSLDFGKPFEEHWLLTYKKIPQPVALSGDVAVVATTLSSGYSHWLLEELPRLLLLGGDAGGTVIANAAHAFGRDALALRGLVARVVSPGRYSHFRCERLVIPSLVGSSDFPTATMIRLLTEFTAPIAAELSAPGERLYITRAKARRRRVVNEGELWRALESRGFAKVSLEDLSWREQIAAFRRAKIVVGPHGAGLANLVFCEAGTRVVELFNRAFMHPGYWRLAVLKGLDYRPVVVAGEEPLAVDLSANRFDVEADVPQVLAALGD